MCENMCTRGCESTRACGRVCVCMHVIVCRCVCKRACECVCSPEVWVCVERTCWASALHPGLACAPDAS